jgi:Cu(I)/Ag(I) efflux system membrane protein CusA/SilA
MAIAVRQLPRTSSDSTLLMALQRLRPKLMTVSVSLFGLVPILWSTGTGADVMIPITVPLIGGTILCYICIISNPYCFEMTKQHELRTKGKIDLIDATH